MEYAACIGHSVSVKGYQQGNVLHLTRSVRDVDRDSSRSFHCPLLIDTPSAQLRPVGSPIEVRAATVDGSSAIEVYRGGSLTLKIDATEIHEKIIGDQWFGGYSFSPDDKYFVYVAVPKKPKATSFFDELKAESSVGTKVHDANKFDAQQDWGEKYRGVTALSLFVLDLCTGDIRMVRGISPVDTIGQPAFSPCGRGLVYTAWRSPSGAPRKLGMIYCYQRPCRLVYAPAETWTACCDAKAEELARLHISLTSHMKLARFPRFSPVMGTESGSLVFLSSEHGFDIHNSSCALTAFDWGKFVSEYEQSKDNCTDMSDLCLSCCRTVVADCSDPVVIAPMRENCPVCVGPFPFPGLYCNNLPARPFVCNEVLLLDAQWRSVAVTLAIDISSNHIRVVSYSGDNIRLSAPFTCLSASTSSYSVPSDPYRGTFSWLGSCPFSTSVVDCHPSHGVALLASDPSSEPVLLHFRTDHVIWKQSMNDEPFPVSRYGPFPPMAIAALKLSNKEDVRNAHVRPSCAAGSRLSSHILYTRVEPVGDASSACPGHDVIESILLLPPVRQGKLPPLVVSPHGGPHSAFTTAYSPHYAEYMCRAGGFAVLLVNYRGSTGFGSHALFSLPGRIGTVDVSDVVSATQSIKNLSPALVSGAACGIVGGSHGGFLTTHIVGQYPDMFQAAAARNPVTNLASMFTTSDIPDWTVVEASGVGSFSFDRYQVPDENRLKEMYLCSPIRYVGATIAPVLVCLGAKDMRVPYSQGMEYYYALKSQRSDETEGEETVKLRVYPEADHAIDIPASEADQWITIMNWFRRFLAA